MTDAPNVTLSVGAASRREAMPKALPLVEKALASPFGEDRAVSPLYALR
ncbi:hypothetical protein [uncultured Nostoc sp.]